MRRAVVVLLVTVLFVLTACRSRQATIGMDAIAALEGQLSVNDGRLYVYKDYAIGWNRFVMRTWMGENGVKPPDMDEYFGSEPFSGVSAIKAQLDFTAQQWGGYVFTNGYLKAGDTEPVSSSGEMRSGDDLTGAVKLTFYARGKEGGERVEFFCGGMGYSSFGAAMPYADSAPMLTTGAVTLSNEWRAYSIALEGMDMSSIGYGFAWVAYAEQNKGREQIEFYMDEVHYVFGSGRTQMLFAPSYEPRATDTEEYILNSIAYTNDNAEACIALFRAGRFERAMQIADALVFASEYDRSFADGRVRNGYTCGNIGSYPGWYSNLDRQFGLMPGFYHKQTMKWHEDSYTVSTNLTSLAWAILALAEAYEQVPERVGYLEAAERIAAFALTLEDEEQAGFYSGFDGWEGAQSRNLSKPTRDNIELYAALKRLSGLRGVAAERAAVYAGAAESALAYILSQFDRDRGCFLPGVGAAVAEGVTCLPENALAVIVLPDHYAEQKACALRYVEGRLAVGEGFAYSSADTGGVSWECTGLMALAYLRMGDSERFAQAARGMKAAQYADGFLPSASADGLFTGLVNTHDNRRIYYYKRKHIGTTAFMAFVDMAQDPFAGR